MKEYNSDQRLTVYSEFRCKKCKSLSRTYWQEKHTQRELFDVTKIMSDGLVLFTCIKCQMITSKELIAIGTE
jgi:hypothetical protein